MNEKQAKERIVKWLRYTQDLEKAELRGFRKGKLQAQKEEWKFLIEYLHKILRHQNNPFRFDIDERIKQLQKEIGGEDEK